MKHALIYVTGLVLLTGCNTLANLHVENPSYSLRSVQPRINLGIPPTMDFDFTLGVNNPNSVALRLDYVDFDLMINNNRVLDHIHNNTGIRIPANGYGDVHLGAHVTYNELRSLFDEISRIVQGNRASYAIQGNAYYDTPVGRLQFPVTVYSR